MSGFCTSDILKDRVFESANFYYSEFFVSRSYPAYEREMRKKIRTDVIDNIKFGVELILQPIRDLIHAPIQILSGYRTYELNKAVRGSLNSDHLYGCAADIICKDYTRGAVEPILIELIKLYIPYKQFIYYPTEGFIHISWNIPGRKVINRQTLIIK